MDAKNISYQDSVKCQWWRELREVSWEPVRTRTNYILGYTLQALIHECRSFTVVRNSRGNQVVDLDFVSNSIFKS